MGHQNKKVGKHCARGQGTTGSHNGNCRTPEIRVRLNGGGNIHEEG